MKKSASKAAKPVSGSLEQLLETVDQLFQRSDDSGQYRYLLGKKRGGWVFEVVHGWDQWLDRRLQYEFRGTTAADSVRRFLQYAKVHSAEVAELIGPIVIPARRQRSKSLR